MCQHPVRPWCRGLRQAPKPQIRFQGLQPGHRTPALPPLGLSAKRSRESVDVRKLKGSTWGLQGCSCSLAQPRAEFGLEIEVLISCQEAEGLQLGSRELEGTHLGTGLQGCSHCLGQPGGKLSLEQAREMGQQRVRVLPQLCAVKSHALHAPLVRRSTVNSRGQAYWDCIWEIPSPCTMLHGRHEPGQDLDDYAACSHWPDQTGRHCWLACQVMC